MDIYLSMAISIILFTIKNAVKNPAHAEQLKSAFLKVRNQINLLYPDESETLP